MELKPPFIGYDHGDLWTFKSLSSHGIESYDIGRIELFDAEGNRLKGNVVGYRVELEHDPKARPEPKRLEALIRTYLEELPSRRRPEGLDNLEEKTLPELVTLLDEAKGR